MFLYYVNVNATNLMTCSLQRAREEFLDIPIEERVYNLLLNLGFKTTNQGFYVVSKMLAESIQGAGAITISRPFASCVNHSIKSAFSTTHLALNSKFLSECGTTKKFLCFTTDFLKNEEDFEWYYQVYRYGKVNQIVTSLTTPTSCINYNAKNISLDTRIETMLDKLEVTNSRHRKCWFAVLKEACLGKYTAVKDCYLCTMGYKYITIYQIFSRTLPQILQSPEYTSITQKVAFSLIPEPERIESTILILASYLRRNMDALWYL